jgi:hypothetical protein
MICVNEAEDVEALMIARDGQLAGPRRTEGPAIKEKMTAKPVAGTGGIL